jgi:hypothetical protein
VRLGFRQIDGFHWLDEDEEGLKRIQSSFSDAQLRIVGTRSVNPESIAPHPRGKMDSGLAPKGAPRNDGGAPPTQQPFNFAIEAMSTFKFLSPRRHSMVAPITPGIAED